MHQLLQNKAVNLPEGLKRRVKILVIVYTPSIPGGYTPTIWNVNVVPFAGLGEFNCREKLYELSKGSL